MQETIAIGLVSGFAILFVMLKLDFWKLLGFDVYVDVACTALFMALFIGTYGGMVAAMVAGLQVSIVLWATKKLLGYLEPDVGDREHWYSVPKIVWTPVPGIFNNPWMAKYYVKRRVTS